MLSPIQTSRPEGSSFSRQQTTSAFRIVYSSIHQIRYDCDSPDCSSNFSRVSDLARHKKTIHGPKRECRFGCGYATARQDKMKEHTRNKHTKKKVSKTGKKRRVAAPVCQALDDEDLPPWQALESMNTTHINQNGNRSDIAVNDQKFTGIGSTTDMLIQSKDTVPYGAHVEGFDEFFQIDLGKPMLYQSHPVDWDSFNNFTVEEGQGQNMHDSELFDTTQWM